MSKIKVVISELANAFGVTNPSRISTYSEAIIQKGCSFEHVKKVCHQAINTLDRFPSLADLLGMLNSVDTTRVGIHRPDIAKKLKDESDRLNEIKKNVSKVLSQEEIGKYLVFWFKCCFGKDTIKSLGAQGLTLRSFEKPALFDLAEANLNPKLAVNIGRRKLGKNHIF